MTKTNLGLVEYVKSKLTLPTIYMLGGFGRILTQSMIDRRVAMGCLHTIRNLATIKAGIGHYCFDCVGIIKGYLWETSPEIVQYDVPAGSDQNVGMVYNACPEKGVLGSMPEIPGLLVFTKDLGHVGVYIGKDAAGNRQYIECTPAWSKWGVCQSNDTIRIWAVWGKYRLIEYIVPVIVKPTPIPVLKFKPGQSVVLNGQVFRNSLLAFPGNSYSGKIVTVEFTAPGAPAPYHVSSIGWVKESALSLYVAPAPIVVKPWDIGNVVRINLSAAKYVTGQKIPLTYKGLRKYTVQELFPRVNPTRALLKEIMSWVYLTDLKKV